MLKILDSLKLKSREVWQVAKGRAPDVNALPFLIIFIIDLLLMLTALFFLFRPGEAEQCLFVVDAKTEILDVASPKSRDAQSAAPPLIANGLTIASNFPAVARAHGANLDCARVKVQMSQDATTDVSCLTPANDIPALQRLAQALKMRRPTLTFKNTVVTLGQTPRDGSTDAALLRSGTVTVQARSWPFRTGVVTSDATLHLGDRMLLEDVNDKDATASGALRAEGELLHVVLNARAVRAKIDRFGQNAPVTLLECPSIWSRLQAERFWAIILLIVALSAHFLGAWQYYAPYHRRRQQCHSLEH